jgi:Calx-beta domain-containing protein
MRPSPSPLLRSGPSTGLRTGVAAIGLGAAALAATAGVLWPSAAWASETITYSYDPLGRLAKVSRSGTVNNGVRACYSQDRADNRSNVTVATADCISAPPPTPLPSFSINNASAEEGQSLTFTVTKTGATPISFTINYATANGTAGTGDYHATSGTLLFDPPDTTRTVTVQTKDNLIIEGGETFYVNLSAATGGATISDSQGAGTIIDNDEEDPCPLC